jgi:hypothetical protein
VTFEPAFPDETEDLAAAVPSHLLPGLRHYGRDRQPTGKFLRAVLENDLMAAVNLADPESYQALRRICQYVYNAMPSTCHGSPEAVTQWLGE